jgi:L-alanine-DL-glutamate epimerase-like enolase superfamily enzyme
MFNDPFAGIEVVNGELAVPNGPGCGVEPVARTAETKRSDVA